MGYDVEDLFASIDEAAVGRFVKGKRAEDLHLEFATAPNGLDADARRKLAKALSGFANSDGGVLVWGVKAKKGREGVDCASQLQVIENLPKFISDLNSQTGEAVSPIIAAVAHEPLPIDANTGYAKTLVPRSDLTPHMAKCREHRYYKRSGDSFYPMEHFDLEDMFGRRPKAVLSLFHQLWFHSSVDKAGQLIHASVGITLGIENSGRGLARSISLWLQIRPESQKCQTIPDIFNRPGEWCFGFREVAARPRERSGDICVASDVGLVIHPDMRCTATGILVNVSRDVFPAFDVVIDYQIAAEGLANVSGVRTIPGGEIYMTAFGDLKERGC